MSEMTDNFSIANDRASTSSCVIGADIKPSLDVHAHSEISNMAALASGVDGAPQRIFLRRLRRPPSSTTTTSIGVGTATASSRVHGFKCGRCSFATNTVILQAQKLREHTTRTHISHDCAWCPFVGADATQLAHHSCVRSFACASCDYVDTRRYMLIRHQQAMHRDGNCSRVALPHTCAVCARVFPSDSKLRTHMRGHCDERPFACDACSYTAKRLISMRKHRRRVHGIDAPKTLQCALCEYATADKKALAMHTLVHADNRPHKCTRCEFAAETRDALRVHQNTHTEVDDIQCAFCAFATDDAAKYALHSRMHLDDHKCCEETHAEVAFCRRQE